MTQATATNTPVAPPTATTTPNAGGGYSSPAGNLIRIPGFDADKADWKFANNGANNGTASFSIVTEGACGKGTKVNVSATGSNIQLYQSGVSLQTNVNFVQSERIC